ncbi:MAG: hypothetical protein GY849_09940 [Deltaproteobacteria bacterium]|nr:hypothetical protein [Deltaproteobacteria bacterium]
MGAFPIFVIRLILSVGFAFITMRIFFQNTSLINVFGLAVILLGLAYLFEFLKRRDGDKGNET